MNRTAEKALRDGMVLFGASIAWYIATNVGDLGLPEAYAPIVGTAALAIYRVLRDRAGGPPPA